MICSNCKATVLDNTLYCGNCGSSLLGSDMQITRNEYTHKLTDRGEFNFKVGEDFGERYKIIEEIGKGGMGRVFKAHDKVLGNDVALKMIRPEFLSNKKMISRFKKEILLAREITNENVVRIHDFGEIEGTKFISMEYIKGRTLKDITRNEGPVDPEKAIEISKAICKGLIAAHKKEIVHRDLKPQNVMIDRDENVYVTDFGLAKSVREKYVSQSGLVIGTPQYIPPELWRGEEADKRSDIYALGIILFEMITGEDLYQSETDYGYLQKHLNEDPEFPLFVKENVPSFYRSLILKCLAKEREARYQDCSEILRDLEDRIFSKGTFIGEVQRSVIKTGPLKIGLALLFIVLISFLSNLLIEKGGDQRKKRSVAILYFKNLSGNKDLDHFSYSLPELLITDLGQSKYIRVLPAEKINSVLKSSDYLGNNTLDPDQLKTAGKKINANYFVQGSFVKSRNNLVVSISLREIESGEILRTNQIESDIGHIFPVIDKLTTEIKKSIKLSESEILADVDNNIEDITTSSQEALKYYIFGKKLFNDGDFKGSIVEYKKAVEIDPEFAMAYREIGYAYVYLGDMKNMEEYFKKMFEHIEKVSEREKLLIYADYYAEIEKDFNKAHESYNKLLAIYPDDINANLESGFFYMWIEDWDNAILKLENVLSEESSDIVAIRDIVTCYLGKGAYSKAEKIINNFEKVFPDNNRQEIRKLKYSLFMLQKRFDIALLVIKEQRKLNEINDQEFLYLKAKIDILNGNLIKSKDVYQKMLVYNKSSLNYEKIANLEFMFLFDGSIEKSLEILNNQIRTLKFHTYIQDNKFKEIYFHIISNKAIKSLELIEKLDLNEINKSIFRKIRLVYLKGLANLNLGRIKESIKLAADLKQLSKSAFLKKQTLRILYHLQGLIEKKKGRYKDAVKEFMKGIEISSAEWGSTDVFVENRTLFYFELGHTNYLSKQYENSKKWFLKISDLSLSRYFFGDLYVKSLYYLGKIYQQKKWKGKAIDSYSKFNSMWKNGDREIVGNLISDANQQLQTLKNKI